MARLESTVEDHEQLVALYFRQHTRALGQRYGRTSERLQTLDICPAWNVPHADVPKIDGHNREFCPATDLVGMYNGPVGYWVTLREAITRLSLAERLPLPVALLSGALVGRSDCRRRKRSPGKQRGRRRRFGLLGLWRCGWRPLLL